LLISIDGVAQSQDRAKIEKEIEALRAQLKQKEEELLAPSAEDRAQFPEFLLQRDTGLARLLPREKYQEKLTFRGGGAYYSFTRGSNSYDRDPQIGLEQESLFTGLPGAGFGFLTSLGDVPLEALTVDHPGVRYLAAFVAPTLEPDAREQQRRIGRGFLESGHHYRQQLPVVVNHTYVLRSIGYGRFDVLVAFRVVRKDTDESVTLLWKKLKEFPTPFLAREQ
jgi:hypothetical protein